MIQAGTKNTPIEAFEAAIETNTTMLLGIWCSGTTTIENELSALSTALSQYGQKFADLVIGISVGSEDLYRTSVSGIANKAGVGQGPDQIVTFIKQAKSAVANTALSSKPIGHVETWEDWGNSSNSAVLDVVDFLGTDLYAYYESDKGNNTIQNAADLFDTAFNATLAAAGKKPVWITETGWPSTGPDFGLAVASVDNAKSYWDVVGCKLFGKVNVFWYNLRDSNPANEAKFAVTANLSTTPLFNLTCPVLSASSTPLGNSTSNSTGSPSATSSGTSSGNLEGPSGSASASATGTGTAKGSGAEAFRGMSSLVYIIISLGVGVASWSL